MHGKGHYIDTEYVRSRIPYINRSRGVITTFVACVLDRKDAIHDIDSLRHPAGDCG